jgi:hypothetical protein
MLLNVQRLMQVNKTLPPVGVKLLVQIDSGWHLVTRCNWVNRKSDSVEFNGVDETFTLNIKRDSIKWMYP